MKNAVIPVAGLGTRLLPATKSQPKEMLPVGRKPVVQYIVEELIHVGIHEILFVTGPGKTSIENHFGLNHELIQTLREKGKEAFLDFLKTDEFLREKNKARLFIDFKYERLKDQGLLETPDGKIQSARELINLLYNIKDENRRDF